MTEQKLIAVWKYDIPPYYLAGEVEQVIEDGWVYVKGYGRMIFKPVKILPYDQGVEVKSKLEELGLKYAEESKKLLDEAKRAANYIVGIK